MSDTGINQATFNSTDLAQGQSGLKRELTLGKTTGKSQFSYLLPQILDKFFFLAYFTPYYFATSAFGRQILIETLYQNNYYKHIRNIL